MNICSERKLFLIVLDIEMVEMFNESQWGGDVLGIHFKKTL